MSSASMDVGLLVLSGCDLEEARSARVASFTGMLTTETSAVAGPDAMSERSASLQGPSAGDETPCDAISVSLLAREALSVVFLLAVPMSGWEMKLELLQTELLLRTLLPWTLLLQSTTWQPP